MHKFKDIAIDIIKEKPKTRTGEPYRDWEYDKRITVVDIDAQEAVKGLIYVDKKLEGHNMLTSWFWGIFEGILADDNVSDVVDVNGSAFIVRTSGDANNSVGYIRVGSSNLAEGFLDYNLKSTIKNLNTTFTLTKTTSDARVILSAPTDVGIQELGIVQNLIDASNSSIFHDVLYSRKVVSISAGKTINWALTFGRPWTLRIAEILYGFLQNANSSVTDTSGTAFTARTAGDIQSGKAYLVYSSDQTTWSPDTYVIPNANGLSMTYWAAYNQRNFRLFGLLGYITPGTDTTANSLAIYQNIYDTSGVTHQVCVAAIPLATPITFYANRVNLVMLRIVAA